MGAKNPGIFGDNRLPMEIEKIFLPFQMANDLSNMSKKLWISEAKKINIRENY